MKRLLLVALSIAGLCIASPAVAAQAKGQTKAKTMTASGTVKSVSADSLTITSGGKDMTFAVDNNTKFVGKGLGAKSKEKSGKMTASEAVAANDQVSVSYHEMGGTMHAASVRVTKGMARTKK
jgi:hypothetical protein